MIADYLYYLWIGGGIGFIIGLGLLAAARAADRKNYIIQRATPMPLSLVNERDDVWLRGEAECDEPLTAPHFGLACLHYSYKLEERVRKKSSGKGYMKHEKELLTRLVDLRGEAVSGGRAGRIAVEGRAAQALVDVSAVVEKYPDLKAQPVVAKLVREMKALEEKIAHGRTTYNDAVREYNENVMSFPRMILARMGGFKAHPFFEATGADRAPAKV